PPTTSTPTTYLAVGFISDISGQPHVGCFFTCYSCLPFISFEIAIPEISETSRAVLVSGRWSGIGWGSCSGVGWGTCGVQGVSEWFNVDVLGHYH
ncbi:hypothetical protein J6590_042525, partial [Homalodisca vitripennis]